MHLTIFETGRPPEPIRGSFPSYPTMLEALLAPHIPGLTCQVVQVLDGHKLPDPCDVEAALITGSPAGVYDDFAWIADLKNWIQRAGEQRVPQVGICFGHQLMAEAFGGRAHKAPQGWGLGRHTYQVHAAEPWMGGSEKRLHLAVSHQDQVLEAPSTARVLAQSDFTPNAALVYDHAPALSFQGHPEFCPRFTDALIRSRRGTRFSEEMADAALASLEAPLDGDVVAAWVAGFYAHALGEKRASLGRVAA
ncbi:MAG: GMP synthase [Alphaproteobacteria bacterium PA1]|nr:MAG: GMP synthase [Alphaproteobacteria bacterium PA1]